MESEDKRKERIEAVKRIAARNNYVPSEDIRDWMEAGLMTLEAAVMMHLMGQTRLVEEKDGSVRRRSCWQSAEGVARSLGLLRPRRPNEELDDAERAAVGSVGHACQGLARKGFVERDGRRGQRRRPWKVAGREIPPPEDQAGSIVPRTRSDLAGSKIESCPEQDCDLAPGRFPQQSTPGSQRMEPTGGGSQHPPAGAANHHHSPAGTRNPGTDEADARAWTPMALLHEFERALEANCPEDAILKLWPKNESLAPRAMRELSEAGCSSPDNQRRRCREYASGLMPYEFKSKHLNILWLLDDLRDLPRKPAHGGDLQEVADDRAVPAAGSADPAMDDPGGTADAPEERDAPDPWWSSLAIAVATCLISDSSHIAASAMD